MKVFSNLPEATLYLNGKKVGTQKADKLRRMVWENIRLEKGENLVKVEGKSGKNMISDECKWVLR